MTVRSEFREHKRLKILISAYACSPYKGSEPAVGWGFVSALAEYHDIWVIVEGEKFRTDIERYLSENPGVCESVRFHYLPKQRNRWLRKIWPPSYYWYYRRWHRDAYRLAQQLHSDVHFDLAHQLTMVGFREPGYLWQLNVPFVWGPVGGMGLFPLRFWQTVGCRGALYYLAYNAINLFQMHFAKRPRMAARNAVPGLIAATPENQAGAMRYWDCPSTLISEVGIHSAASSDANSRKPGESLRIVWVGLHIPRKALNLALDALARLPKHVNWELHVLGDGPLNAAWQRHCAMLGLSEYCKFHGWLSRAESMEVMSGSHLMLITSLRDLTSTVTIEALAAGLPIVCLDHCGFSAAVDDSCGIKVDLTTPSQVADDLAAAITRLADDEALRHRLSLGAIARSCRYSWDQKAKAVNDIYGDVLAAWSIKSN